ncbi:dihydrouridine synthase [Cooperia oncophora]
MTALTLETVMRRFTDVHSVSQEAIETISLWVMHYKDKRSIDIIVEAWLESFKIAKKDEQRIALFYIMNDVVQRAKNKHMDVLIPTFQPAVLSAVTMGKSSPSVKHAMQRCIDIFGERQVFTEASVNAMKNMLQSEENGEGDESYVELDSEEVYRKIELFERGRLIVTRGMEVIRNGDFDCRALMKERMRDRTVAAQLVMETQQVLSQITSFRHSMEEQKRKMLQLIETLELAKRNFSHQLKDVTVVEDAYQKYFQGIREVHADLLEMEKSGIYPAATPPRDAPSPTANDDIYATGVENAMQSFRVPGARDNMESADMDLDDDSAPIDVGGTSPLSGNLPPPPAPPALLEGRPPAFLASTTPQQPIMPISQLTSNGSTVSQFLNNSNTIPQSFQTQPSNTMPPSFQPQPSNTMPPSFQTQPTYGVSQSQPSTFVSPTNTAVAPPSAGQPSSFTGGHNLSVPPPIATQPPPNIQALLKSIPSLQTIQQATAAAAAAAAAAANNQRPTQNLPPMNYPPPVAQQRFGDVDERIQPVQQIPTVQPMQPVQPIQPVQTMQPPVQPMQQPIQTIHPIQTVITQPPSPNFHMPPPRPQQPVYAEEGPSNLDYQASVPGGDHEHHNGDSTYYGEGGRDEFYQKPPPGQQFHNSGNFGNFSSPGRGRPHGGGFYGRGGGRGDQWRKSGDFRGGRGFGGPRGNPHNRSRGGPHGGGGFQGGGLSGMVPKAVEDFDAEEHEVHVDVSNAEADGRDTADIFRIPKTLTLGPAVRNTPQQIASKRSFWRNFFADKKNVKVVAPMVDQSELAFRMFMRKYGAHITVTPMIHAHLFVNDPTYRRNSLALCETDRPLIVQFCANKPDTFLAACRLVEGLCDGVDLNLGCPQMVAKKGRYGAYLQDEVDLVCSMVSAVRDFCALPVSCKIRIRDCPKQTIEYARRLVDAGATMWVKYRIQSFCRSIRLLSFRLTVHGRTREMKGADTGLADWSRIREVVEAVDVPVVANGNIQMPGDVERCLAETKAAAVMSAEGLLYNPLLFVNRNEESWLVAKEYLEYARRYQAGTSAVRAHIFRICHHSLLEFADLRMRVSTEHRLEDYESIVEELRIRTRAVADSEEARHRIALAKELFERIRCGDEKMDPIEVSRTPHWICKPYFRLSEMARETIVGEGEKTYKEKRKEHLQKIADEMGLSLKQARKRERRKLNGQRTIISKRMKFPPCTRCTQPAGQGCAYVFCKKCCRWTCKQKGWDCNAHRFKYAHTAVEQSEENELVDDVSEN